MNSSYVPPIGLLPSREKEFLQETLFRVLVRFVDDQTDPAAEITAPLARQRNAP